ncbi:hypothetical protein ACK3TF_005751 [Chlorella vulgaris]
MVLTQNDIEQRLRANVFGIRAAGGQRGTAFLLSKDYHGGLPDHRLFVTNHHVVHRGATPVLKVDICDTNSGDILWTARPVSEIFYGTNHEDSLRPPPPPGYKPLDLALLFSRVDNNRHPYPEGLSINQEPTAAFSQTCQSLPGSVQQIQAHILDIDFANAGAEPLTGMAHVCDLCDYYIKLIVVSGNSGGPVIDHNGNVTAVVKQGELLVNTTKVHNQLQDFSEAVVNDTAAKFTAKVFRQVKDNFGVPPGLTLFETIASLKADNPMIGRVADKCCEDFMANATHAMLINGGGWAVQARYLSTFVENCVAEAPN